MSLAVPGTWRVRLPDAATWRLAPPLAFCAALWILCHPYYGVVHDARLYLIQAFHRLDPARWDQDLYFRYGSQDAFSVFTSAYAPIVASLGVGVAHLAATIAGEVLWFCALCALAFALFEKPLERYAAIASVTLLSAAYGGLGIFHYAEPFATPRLWSEGFVIAAFAAGVRGRTVTMVALMAMATAFHPLMAAAGVGVALLYAALSNPRVWWLIGFLGVGVTLACILRFGPFARLWETYDPDWWWVVDKRCQFLLVGDWRPSDLVHTAANFAGLVMFLTVATLRERRMAVTIILVGMAGLAASWVGADGMQNVLVTGVQLWRATWLVAVAGNLVTPLVLLRREQRDAIFWTLAIALTAEAVARLAGMLGELAPWLVLAAALLVLLRFPLSARLASMARIPLWTAAVFAGLAATEEFAVQLSRDFLWDAHLTLIGLAALILPGVGFSARGRNGLWFATVAVALMAASGSLADRRTHWSRFVYDGSTSDRGLDAFLANSGATWWEGDDGLSMLWFRARHPAYAGCLEGTEGSLVRGEALQWKRRITQIWRLDTVDLWDCPWHGRRPLVTGASSPAQLASLCRALPDLDTMVLDYPVPGLAGRSWRSPVFILGVRDRHLARVSTFWRYDCGPLRGAPQPLAR